MSADEDDYDYDYDIYEYYMSMGIITVFIVFLFSTILCIPIILVTTIGRMPDDYLLPEECLNNQSYPEFYRLQETYTVDMKIISFNIESMVDAFFSKYLPCLISPIMSVLLIEELVRANKRRKSLGNNKEKSDKTSKLVLYQTLSMIVAEVPIGFSMMIGSIYEDDVGFLVAMKLNYKREMDDITSFSFIVYDDLNKIRSRIIKCMVFLSFILITNHLVIITTSIKFYTHLNKIHTIYSQRQHKMNIQLYKVLTLHIFVPSLILCFHFVSFFIQPFMNLHINESKCILLSFITIYPTINALISIFMIQEIKQYILLMVFGQISIERYDTTGLWTF
ncbi:unnamed protein product [Caenorhabditis angaria]|uniref:G-protein coupled receptors family 1 profile domain-containing protein n=1 Tax=Caenorhabditis angaria TaxID=860376 RepID=A0A9P1IZ28_9PELO|nr:unnamed protein product [Caenorhabditis angaria]